jgi:predicted DNA-binding ribbon-helix-helix protein
VTHTLHRFGDRKDDFPWLITPRVGVNTDNLSEKLDKAIQIINRVGIKVWGFGASKNTLMVSQNQLVSELMEAAQKSSAVARLRGVCTSKEQLKEFVKELKEANLGLSVTISGLIDEIFNICKELDIKPHSINLSLGVWGKKELIPKEEILEITTMCGHGLVSPRFVEYVISEIKKGRMTPKTAARLLARQCPCGIFNVEKAEKLLARLTKSP